MTNAKDLAARLRGLAHCDPRAGAPLGTQMREAADLIEQQATEIERLRATLNDIANPIAAWQRDLRPGYSLDGETCVRMSNDPETYRRMAREALQAGAAIDAAMKGTT